MRNILARLVSGVIPNRELRHSVRRRMMMRDQPVKMNTRERYQHFYKSVGEVITVQSLHRYVDYYDKIGKILRALTPYDAVGVEKVRIGGATDGGYAMLDPGVGGVAYSFGISDQSPWDLEMARRGFDVFQFDGTISEPPDVHPKLHFQKFNISSPSKVTKASKCLEQLFSELGHSDCDDIILQMDIEGSEWDVFDEASAAQLRKFKQIIIEWHDLFPDRPELDRYLAILEKVTRTHKPVHVHLNNFGCPALFNDGLLFYSPIFEVSYARIGDYEFSPSPAVFPTPLDAPNDPDFPDIAIGSWRA